MCYKVIRVVIAFTFLFSSIDISPILAHDKLSISMMSDDGMPLPPGGEGKDGVAHRAKPGAIGNGQPLIDLFSGKPLPPRITNYEKMMIDSILYNAINKAIELTDAALKIGEHDMRHRARQEATLANLKALKDNYDMRLYLFSAIVKNREEYLIGFSRDGYVAPAIEIIKWLSDDRFSTEEKIRLIAQYMYHECVPEKEIILPAGKTHADLDDRQLRGDHRVVYKEMQSDVFGKGDVEVLRKELGAFLDEQCRPSVANKFANAADIITQIGGVKVKDKRDFLVIHEQFQEITDRIRKGRLTLTAEQTKMLILTARDSKEEWTRAFAGELLYWQLIERGKAAEGRAMAASLNAVPEWDRIVTCGKTLERWIGEFVEMMPQGARDSIEGQRPTVAEKLKDYVRGTTAFLPFIEKHNIPMLLTFDGRAIEKDYVENSKVGKKAPLRIYFTGEGDIANKAILNGALYDGVRNAEAMLRKNALWQVYLKGRKGSHAAEKHADGSVAFRSVSAVYGNRELFKRGLVMAKGGDRLDQSLRIAGDVTFEGPNNDEDSIFEKITAANVVGHVLGYVALSGPDRVRNVDHKMDVILDATDRYTRLWNGETTDSDYKLNPFRTTTSASPEKGSFSHMHWFVTSTGGMHLFLTILRNRDYMNNLNKRRQSMGKSTVDPENISTITQGFGDVGSGDEAFFEKARAGKKYDKDIIRRGMNNVNCAIYSESGIKREGRIALRRAVEAAPDPDKVDIFNIVDLRRMDKVWLSPSQLLKLIDAQDPDVKAALAGIIPDLKAAQNLLQKGAWHKTPELAEFQTRILSAIRSSAIVFKHGVNKGVMLKDINLVGIDVNEVIYQKADVVIPAAVGNVFTSEEKVKELQCAILFELANNAVRSGMEKYLKEAGIDYFRGELNNGLGILCSTEEGFHVALNSVEYVIKHMDYFRQHIYGQGAFAAQVLAFTVLSMFKDTGYKGDLSEIVINLADELGKKQDELLLNNDPEVMQEAKDNVARSGGRLPLRVALLQAASEKAFTKLVYEKYFRDNKYKGKNLARDVVLNPALKNDQDMWSSAQNERLVALLAIGRFRNMEAVPAMLGILNDAKENIEIRCAAAESLGYTYGYVADRPDILQDPVVVSLFAHALKGVNNTDEEVNELATFSRWALEKMGFDWDNPVRGELSQQGSAIRERAIRAMGTLKVNSPEVVSALISLVTKAVTPLVPDPDPKNKDFTEAERAEYAKGKRFYPYTDDLVLEAAIWALGEIGVPAALQALNKVIEMRKNLPPSMRGEDSIKKAAEEARAKMDPQQRIFIQVKSPALRDFAAYNLTLFTSPDAFQTRMRDFRNYVVGDFKFLNPEEKKSVLYALSYTVYLLSSPVIRSYTLLNTKKYPDSGLTDANIDEEVKNTLQLLSELEKKEGSLAKDVLNAWSDKLAHIQLKDVKKPLGPDNPSIGLLAEWNRTAPKSSLAEWVRYWNKKVGTSRWLKTKLVTGEISGNDYGPGTSMLIAFGVDLVMMNPTLAIRALAENDDLQKRRDEFLAQNAGLGKWDLLAGATKIAGSEARTALRAIFHLTSGRRGRVSFQVNARSYNNQEAMAGDILKLGEELDREAQDADSQLLLNGVLTEEEMKVTRGRTHTFFKVDSSSPLVYGKLEQAVLDSITPDGRLDLSSVDTGGAIEQVLSKGRDVNGTVAGSVADGIDLYLAQIIGHRKAAKNGYAVHASIITKMAGRIEGALRWIAIQKVIKGLKDKKGLKDDDALIQNLKKIDVNKNGALDDKILRAAASEIGLILPSDRALCRAGSAICQRSKEILDAMTHTFASQGVQAWETGDLLASTREAALEDGNRVFYHFKYTGGMPARGWFPFLQHCIEAEESMSNADFNAYLAELKRSKDARPEAMFTEVEPELVKELIESGISEDFLRLYEPNENQARILKGLRIYREEWGAKGLKVEEYAAHPFAQQTLFGKVYLAPEFGFNAKIPSTEEEKDAVRTGFVGDCNMLADELAAKAKTISETVVAHGPILSEGELRAAIGSAKRLDAVYDPAKPSCQAARQMYSRIVAKINEVCDELNARYPNDQITTQEVTVIPGTNPEGTLIELIYTDHSTGKRMRKVAVYQSYIEDLVRLQASLGDKIIAATIEGNVFHETGHGYKDNSGIDAHDILANDRKAVVGLAQALNLKSEEIPETEEDLRLFAEAFADAMVAGKGGDFTVYVTNQAADRLFALMRLHKPEEFIRDDGTVNEKALNQAVADYFDGNKYMRPMIRAMVHSDADTIIDLVAEELVDSYTGLFGRGTDWYIANIGRIMTARKAARAPKKVAVKNAEAIRRAIIESQPSNINQKERREAIARLDRFRQEDPQGVALVQAEVNAEIINSLIESTLSSSENTRREARQALANFGAPAEEAVRARIEWLRERDGTAHKVRELRTTLGVVRTATSRRPAARQDLGPTALAEGIDPIDLVKNQIADLQGKLHMIEAQRNSILRAPAEQDDFNLATLREWEAELQPALTNRNRALQLLTKIAELTSIMSRISSAANAALSHDGREAEPELAQMDDRLESLGQEIAAYEHELKQIESEWREKFAALLPAAPAIAGPTAMAQSAHRRPLPMDITIMGIAAAGGDSENGFSFNKYRDASGLRSALRLDYDVSEADLTSLVQKGLLTYGKTSRRYRFTKSGRAQGKEWIELTNALIAAKSPDTPVKEKISAIKTINELSLRQPEGWSDNIDIMIVSVLGRYMYSPTPSLDRDTSGVDTAAVEALGTVAWFEHGRKLREYLKAINEKHREYYAAMIVAVSKFGGAIFDHKTLKVVLDAIACVNGSPAISPETKRLWTDALINAARELEKKKTGLFDMLVSDIEKEEEQEERTLAPYNGIITAVRTALAKDRSQGPTARENRITKQALLKNQIAYLEGMLYDAYRMSHNDATIKAAIANRQAKLRALTEPGDHTAEISALDAAWTANFASLIPSTAHITDPTAMAELGGTGAGETGQKILGEEILYLGIPSVAINNALLENRITTVGDLVAKTREELLTIKGIGPANVDVIEEALAEHKLELVRPPQQPTLTAADPELLSRPAADLLMSIPRLVDRTTILDSLSEAEIETIGELVKLNEVEVRSLGNIGRTRLELIKTVLEPLKLELAQLSAQDSIRRLGLRFQYRRAEEICGALEERGFKTIEQLVALAREGGGIFGLLLSSKKFSTKEGKFPDGPELMNNLRIVERSIKKALTLGGFLSAETPLDDETPLAKPDQSILDKPVTGLPGSTYLENAGIKTIGDLVKLTPAEVMAIRTFDAKRCEKLKQALAAQGLELAKLSPKDPIRRLRMMTANHQPYSNDEDIYKMLEGQGVTTIGQLLEKTRNGELPRLLENGGIYRRGRQATTKNVLKGEESAIRRALAFHGLLEQPVETITGPVKVNGVNVVLPATLHTTVNIDELLGALQIGYTESASIVRGDKEVPVVLLQDGTFGRSSVDLVGSELHVTTISNPEKLIEAVGVRTVDLKKVLEASRVDIAKVAIIVKRGLDDSATMTEGLTKLVGDKKRVVEVSTDREMSARAQYFLEQGLKVIILDEEGAGSLTQNLSLPNRTAGKDYCVVQAQLPKSSLGRLDTTFVNLYAMSMIGAGVLNNSEDLFRSAYRTFAGFEPPQNVMADFRKGTLGIIGVLPPIIRLTGERERDADLIRRLVGAAA